jgi:CheY-like chemotaxis protein
MSRCVRRRTEGISDSAVGSPPHQENLVNNHALAAESSFGLRHCFGENGRDDTPQLPLTHYDSLRILLVSDDMQSAARLKRTLQSLGYSETLVAYSGKRALGAVTAYSPAVAIVDLYLADMTGYSLARSLRTHTALPVRQLPLIAVAEQVEFATEELARAAGFLGVLTKPITVSLLNGLLLRSLM